MNLHISTPPGTRAFSRTDLLAVVVVMAVLGAGLFFYLGKSRGSTGAQCAANLKQLGVAMAIYEQDNGGRLPYAYVRFVRSTDFSPSPEVWDSLIFPLVPLGQNGLQQKHLLRCPADTIPGYNGNPRRTYAMPTHGNREDDWPLAADNNTGVGVWFDTNLGKRHTVFMTNFFSFKSTAKADGTPGAPVLVLPAYKVDMISAPAGTLLLTENAWPANTLFNYHGAVIDSAQTHVATNLDLSLYHGGKINYLMVDGHVETLYPLESMGQTDPRDGQSSPDYHNIWTVRSDD
jgi:prepilin-type processing-associated H-X9-DG protein